MISENLQGKLHLGLLVSLLAKFQIPLPSLQEQKQIAEHLRNLDELIENERKYLATLEGLKRTWMNLLLTGKVRVPKQAEDVLREVLPDAGR